MVRLPIPGQDDGSWGDILNSFLSVAHNPDGTLQNSAITNAGGYVKPSSGIPKGDLATSVQTSLNSADSAVQPARQVATGNGLAGGGDLSADRTLAVVNDTTTQKIELSQAGVLVGTRKRLNFTSGSNVTVSAVDDSANNKVDVTVSATGVTALSSYGQQQLAAQRAQALTPFLSSLANRHYARCNVVCIGDSITEGQGATQADRRWIARLRDNLRTRFQTAGLSGGGRGFLGASNSGESSFVWPATLAGSPGSGITLGPKSQFLQFSASGQSVTYSLTGDSADIMWTQVGFGGTFSWQVDGGSATNISTNGGSVVDGELTHISLGAAGAHTLTLAWISGNSDVDGIIEYNGDYSSGIQVHDAGHYGWQASNWVNATANGTSGPAAAMSALNPSAIVITLGVNDQFSNVNPAVFQTNLTTLISQLRAAQTAPYPSVILNMLPPRQNQSGYTYPWSQYVAAAWNIAAADTGGPGGSSIVTVMDFTLGPRMPGADADVYGSWQAGDLVHPSDKGHSLIADYLAQFLTSS